MKKGMRFMAALVLAALLCQGCGVLPAVPAAQNESKMVMQITVESLPADEARDRVYTEPDKIGAVLDYLKSVNLVENYSNQPESGGGATRRITVTYAGGRELVYYLAGEEYMRVGDAPWMCMDGGPETGLEEILRSNPSDVPEQGAV